MKKVLLIFGTRPEAIKMAPLVKEFQKHPEVFDTRVCVTAQHREMLDQVLEFFEISPDYDLNLMTPGQNLHKLTTEIINQTRDIIEVFKPDYVFVHGDTTTAMASALSAFYCGVKICHVEAGLRTFDKKSPFPEEINRQFIGRIADLHFAPTILSSKNLLKEGINKKNVVVTGNTVIDALFYGLKKLKSITHIQIEELKNLIGFKKEIILVTGHRRENHGEGIKSVCSALREVALKHPQILIVYPVHPNPKIMEPVNELLKEINNILLIQPLSYPAFIWLMQESKIILTDSGGIQEEAPSLCKPVLVMREETERPEALESGIIKLVGTDQKTISKEISELLNNYSEHNIGKIKNPYGNGNACLKILEAINKQNI